ncbi:MAG: hypothetical protein D6730_16995, partial [Bacteroidetes bacterium]
MLWGVFCLGQGSDLPQHQVFLLGNVADLPYNSTFYSHFNKLLSELKGPFTVLLSGDLTASEGSGPGLTSEDSFKVEQIMVATSGFAKGRLVIIPGDRDWAFSGKNGWQRVKALEKLVRSTGYQHVHWAIRQGCPGPEIIELSGGLRLIAIQTQWWNHPYEKPRPANASCRITSNTDFLEELRDILDASLGKNVLITGHFPLISAGEYGGSIPPKKHLFPLTDLRPGLYIPLPLLGSLYASFRQNVGTHQDIINTHFDEFRSAMEELMLDRHSLMYLSGHEHNLQILRQGDNYHINSGALGQTSRPGKDKRAHYLSERQGIIELLYQEHGDIYARIHHFEEETGFEPPVERFLFQSVCNVGQEVVPFNTAHLLCGDATIFHDASPTYDSVMPAMAGAEYKAGPLKKLFFGKHYRSSWTRQLQLPVLNLDTTRGGLQVLASELNFQTPSLRFGAGNGLMYQFRSINKDPLRSLQRQLRSSLIGYVIQDQTSTQHPYGVLVTHPLMQQLGILHPRPFLYLMPDDDKLGIYRSDFGLKPGFLEEIPQGRLQAPHNFAGADDLLKSYMFFRYRYEFPQLQVDQLAYARARIFDLWVGDWDRQEDNWHWALYTTDAARLIARPVAFDRDQAFARWDGFFPWLADREWMHPAIQHFGTNLKGVRSLSWHSRHIDRLLLTALTREQWQALALEVQAQLTDSLIETALAAMPPEVYELTAEELRSKLRSRREQLLPAVESFYDLLAKEVDIVGTNLREVFDVQRRPDGAVVVRVYRFPTEEEALTDSLLWYERTFLPEETREVRLFGLDGEDVFQIHGKSRRSIRLRIVGGPAPDVIRETSEV